MYQVREKRMKNGLLLLLLCAVCVTASAKDTFAPASAETVPTTFDELWSDFDPREEPLDVEILHEFEEGGVVMKVIRYRVGMFKGQKAMMAAVYGYPKGGKHLPGLVQVHGGGQSASYKACLANAKRGYATISLAWAGRINAPNYEVLGAGAKLFFEGKTNDPHYKVTTDWGALDGYHAPGRYRRDFGSVSPDDYTIDPVESPRNSGWFLCALGARRALTFLEQQPEVDGEHLGVYGHSMGAQITSYTAGTDARVKAAAPSCGGISYRGSEKVSEQLAFGNKPYLERTTCPIIFLNPANDFHGHVAALPLAVSEIKSEDWRITSAPHHCHQDSAPYEVATQLWFDQYLKGSFTWPETPRTDVTLKTAKGTPIITVRPDSSRPILSLQVFYAQQGPMPDRGKEHLNRGHRFWRSAKVVKKGDVWSAELPLFTTDEPLWVFANARYPLDEPVSGVGYYYQPYSAESYNVSSVVEMFEPGELQAAGVKPTITPTTLIEDFQGDWEQEWFTYNRKSKVWERKTNKLYDPMYQAPRYGKIAFGVASGQAGKLTVAVDDFSKTFDLDGSGERREIDVLPLDLVNKDGKPRINWKGIKLLRLSFKPAKNVDAEAPVLRNLRWIERTREAFNENRTFRLGEAEVMNGKTYLDIAYADQVRRDLPINMNKSFGGDPMAIGGKDYDRGIGTHANSELIFFLKGQYTRLYAEVGVQRGLPGSIRFTVLADGEKVFESGVMKKGSGPKVVDVDVTDVHELELVVDDGGNGKHADHANWAEVYIHGGAIAEGRADDLRVMSFNVRNSHANDVENKWNLRKDLVYEVVRDYAPDVLGLQEANRFQMAELNAEFSEYAAIGIGSQGGSNGQYSAILYLKERFEAGASGDFWLSETPEKPSRDWSSAHVRICTWAQLVDQDTEQRFMCTTRTWTTVRKRHVKKVLN